MNGALAQKPGRAPEECGDETFFRLLDFGNATLSVRDSVNCTTYALRAGSVGGCGSLGYERDFLHLLSGANLLVNIVDGSRGFSGQSDTIGPDEKTEGVIRQKVGVTSDVHNFCYGSPFHAHDQSKRSYGR